VRVPATELRLALNEIDGVDIPESQLGGWPTFPISALEDPANLVRLIAVLDRIATESHAARPVEYVQPEEGGDHRNLDRYLRGPTSSKSFRHSSGKARPRAGLTGRGSSRASPPGGHVEWHGREVQHWDGTARVCVGSTGDNRRHAGASRTTPRVTDEGDDGQP